MSNLKIRHTLKREKSNELGIYDISVQGCNLFWFFRARQMHKSGGSGGY